MQKAALKLPYRSPRWSPRVLRDLTDMSGLARNVSFSGGWNTVDYGVYHKDNQLAY